MRGQVANALEPDSVVSADERSCLVTWNPAVCGAEGMNWARSTELRGTLVSCMQFMEPTDMQFHLFGNRAGVACMCESECRIFYGGPFPSMFARITPVRLAPPPPSRAFVISLLSLTVGRVQEGINIMVGRVMELTRMTAWQEAELENYKEVHDALSAAVAATIARISGTKLSVL